MAVFSAIGLAFLLGIGFLIYFVVDQTRAAPLKVASEDSTEIRIEKIESWLQSIHESKKEIVNFNGAVLIMKNQKVLMMDTWGYTDVSGTTELSIQSSLRLASVSKQFTAAAILVLASQHKLDLDDRVDLHLKSFPFDDVTIRHLLNMTSGIPDCYMSLADTHKDTVGDVLSIQEVVQLIGDHPPNRNYDVNEIYQYSNTSYVLLAGVVEAVSGESFEDFTSKELFEPLGMKNTRVWNLMSSTDSFPNKTKSFMFSDNLEPEFLDGVAGDGAVFSSIEDFVIWERFWRENDLVDPELLKQAFLPVTLKDGTDSDYGFGWVTTEDGAWHNGSWLGARTYVLRDDANELFIVVLDSSSSQQTDTIAEQIHEAMRQ